MEDNILIDQPHMQRRTLLLFTEAVLRPVIRILLRYGVSTPEFTQIARKLFVDIAMQEPEFRIPRRRRQYKSRVALLTALSRKEVLRLLDARRPADDPELQQSNRAARVLNGWLNDERYRDAKGRPLSLPFRAPDGKRSFSELVGEYSGDIPPRAVLDDLIATETCVSTGDDDIRVARNDYVAKAFNADAMTAAAMSATSYLARIDAQLSPFDIARERTERPVAVHSAVAQNA
ncbi:MAG: hypothetical protein KY410_10770 [Proteobacteria bacterium]|nr:hypothetical protein [Pseudomonadota bacterium]